MDAMLFTPVDPLDATHDAEARALSLALHAFFAGGISISRRDLSGVGQQRHFADLVTTQVEALYGLRPDAVVEIAALAARHRLVLTPDVYIKGVTHG